MPHRLCLVVGGETCPLGQGRDWKDPGLVLWSGAVGEAAHGGEGGAPSAQDTPLAHL